MSEIKTVRLLTANNKPVRDGFMVVGDGEVDGQKTDVFFWDPPQADKLQPGVVVTVVFDGKNARWQTRDGKTSFHIRKLAEVTFESGGTPPPTQAARTHDLTPTSTGGQDVLSWEDGNDQAFVIMTDMYHRAQEAGFPEEMCQKAGLQAPILRAQCWFGEKRLIT